MCIDKEPKKTGAKRDRTPTRPKYKDMLAIAMAEVGNRYGCTLKALVSYLIEKFDLGSDRAKVSKYVKAALKAGLKSGRFKAKSGPRGTTKRYSLVPMDRVKQKRKEKKAKKAVKDAKLTATKVKKTSTEKGTKPKKTSKTKSTSTSKKTKETTKKPKSTTQKPKPQKN